ncbi:MAG: hypothetical protein Q8P49_00250 [Candidatus Liptonbacteria bacterium]|nr:hypothetical protein [Candidatus Liptonbacteria bacterium]
MSYKLFVSTHDGDRIRIGFSYEEERDAFESAVEKIRRRVAKNDPREKEINDFRFDITLEMEVAREHISDIQKILGLRMLNIFSNEAVYILPLAGHTN